MQYRVPEQSDDWHEVPANKDYGLDDMTAAAMAEIANDNSAGELLQGERGQLRDDLIIELREHPTLEVKRYEISADYSIDYYAHEILT